MTDIWRHAKRMLMARTWQQGTWFRWYRWGLYNIVITTDSPVLLYLRRVWIDGWPDEWVDAWMDNAPNLVYMQHPIWYTTPSSCCHSCALDHQHRAPALLTTYFRCWRDPCPVHQSADRLESRVFQIPIMHACSWSLKLLCMNRIETLSLDAGIGSFVL